jgi:CelD/BcsL family acetyltransferase involved in cellulose biosynthesis
MRITLARWEDVRPDVARRWIELRRNNPSLGSPYFHPKFTGIVSSIRRRDTELAIIEENDGAIVGLLPFHRLPGNIGVPIGDYLSDYNGLICEPDFKCDMRSVLRQCRLIAFDFYHLVPQPSFVDFQEETEISPQIDLSGGFAAYAATQKAVKREQTKIRRLARDHGPLRFVPHTTDSVALNHLFVWKQKQYRNAGKDIIFSQSWTTDVLQEIIRTNDRDFGGMLSVLYSGDRIAAVHLGMRTQTIWHQWFPAYDPELADYSPGLILLLRMAEHAPSIGIKIIDFGKGMSEVKQRFMNAGAPVASGRVELLSARWARRRLRRTAVAFARKLRVESYLRALMGQRDR